jgi:DNA-binding response OmpR family regulator
VFNKVLIVEDEPLLRDLIASHLSLNGYAVSEASNGIDCIKQVERSMPDLVLLDLNMPLMGGAAVLRKLRDIGADCPVVMITACNDPGKLVEVQALGAVNILAKPFSLSAISIEVRKYLVSTGQVTPRKSIP